MFCADYISSFLFHGFINLSLIHNQNIKELKSIENSSVFPFFIGGLAGFLGAASVFPFDFVRRGVIQGKIKFRHSLSTVPYSGVFFGLYFTARRETTSSQVFWALVAAASACVAEVPFDKAKQVMMGNRRTMLLMNGMYIPFGALMLVMYDKAIINYRNKFTQKWIHHTYLWQLYFQLLSRLLLELLFFSLVKNYNNNYCNSRLCYKFIETVIYIKSYEPRLDVWMKNL